MAFICFPEDVRSKRRRMADKRGLASHKRFCKNLPTFQQPHHDEFHSAIVGELI